MTSPTIGPRGVSLLAFAWIAVAASGSASFAQESPFSREPLRLGPAYQTTSVAVGDVDRDGDLDLVFGNFEDRESLYRNDGGTFPSITRLAADTLTVGVALGDVDGDGDLDLVCGNGGGWVGGESNRLYINEGGTFADTPVWESSPSNETWAVALGDVDGDGDLDLVCGNGGNFAGQSNALYRNDGGTFTVDPIWTSAPANWTRDVILGDVNGDGQLDLVCGNDTQCNTLYLNVGGTFSDTTAWCSSLARNTRAVALGDVDGDGVLDLVCGNNENQRSTLYLNEGGTFALATAWVPPAELTLAVTLGDADGDGDLDLACGNVAGNTLYLNEDGMLATSPVWSSDPANLTRTVAFGDVDGDGDLDLVCGNFGWSNTLYVNMRRPLASTPAWQPGANNRTRAVALGDVDGDGDLDLVCGNNERRSSHGSNTLYLNEQGTLALTPVWSSDPDATRAVAFGDVDGDGDLDLVCGNETTSSGGTGLNRLYLNEGGTFADTSVWTSSLPETTHAVALGDVNGDGDLDLVCGNVGARNTLYLNEGGTFADTSAWESAPANDTRDVALGDVDGDGDLDLVCGNMWVPQTNTLYRNDGGMFTRDPVWFSGEEEQTRDVALGDVDGDGDLDLVCGNFEQPNTAYRNQGGIFANAPFWVSWPEHDTQEVALGDLDGDGDLDLVCVNFDGHGQLYRNDGGMFTRDPVWSSLTGNGGMAVALGDMDGDGDLDLACGNYFEKNTLYLGLKDPVFTGEPASPTNQLPNNGAHLRHVTVEAPQANVRRLLFRAVDVDSDSVWILPEYQREGAPVWHPIEVIGADRLVGPIKASPQGVERFFDWDVSVLPYDDRNVVARLRVISNPARTGRIRYAPSYFLPLGQITPDRPEVAWSPSALEFLTVTVGDTVLTSFTLTNAGTMDLIVSNVAPLPSPEMRLVQPSLPDTIAAGETVAVIVSLEPRGSLGVPGEVTVHSNDPLRPQLALPVTTDIRDLEISSRLLSSEDPLPLGDAVTVIVTPDPDVRVERGFVYHRSVGDAAFDSLALSPSGSDWIAVIPGAAVTERGLEYYVEVENSRIFKTDPPGAPDSTYLRAVAAPLSIFAEARPTSGSAYLEGREIDVLVTLPVGVSFTSGTLHYRRGGESSYLSTSLETGGLLPSASIPEGFVGPRGIEYWVDVVTATTTLTDPAQDPMVDPHGIPVTVTRLAEPTTHAGRRYRMLSVPLDFGESAATIEALLADQPEFGPHDPKRWQASTYVTEETPRYVELGPESGNEHLRPVPGRAFWLINKSEHRVDTAPLSGRSTRTAGPYEISLARGWTMLGNPFDFAVSWESVSVSSGKELLTGPIRWDPESGTYDYETAIALEPFEGYWVHNAASEISSLQIPAVEAAVPVALARATEPGWRFALRATTAGSVAGIVLGADPDAIDSHDERDLLAPPRAPGPWIRFGVDHRDWPRRPGLYGQDLRAPDPDGARWNLLVRTAEIEEVRVAPASSPQLPAGWRLRLVDLEQETSVDPLAAGGCRLLSFGPEHAYRLVLLAGTEEFVSRQTDTLVSIPAVLTLRQNAPNPFRSATRIRFGVPSAGPVALEIFDVRGARVASPVRDPLPAGYHAALWDGRDARGRRVAAGVYFYRVKTTNGTLTRKMIVLR